MKKTTLKSVSMAVVVALSILFGWAIAGWTGNNPLWGVGMTGTAVAFSIYLAAAL